MSRAFTVDPEDLLGVYVIRLGNLAILRVNREEAIQIVLALENALTIDGLEKFSMVTGSLEGK